MTSPQKFKNLAWIGLGNFGLPIAKQCIDANYEVTGFTVDGHGIEGVKELVKSGGFEAENASLKDFEALILCLPRSEDIDYIIQIYQNCLPEIIIDLSTVGPYDTKRRYDELKKQSTLLIDCPVSGSKINARNGQLTVFAGYKESKNLKVDHFLSTIGSNVFFFDKPGKGNAAKLVNQLMHLSIVGIIRDGLNLAKHIELDLDTTVSALRTASGNSAMLERFGEKIVQEDFSTQFALELAYKDIKLVENLIEENSLNLPYHNLSKGIYKEAMEKGLGASNFTIICKN